MDHSQPTAQLPTAEAERFFTEGVQAGPEETAALRHPCCGALRRALHKPDCPRAQSNCPACTGVAAAHLRSCPKSVVSSQLKLPGDTCCAGVDVPAVGQVHSWDCENAERRVLRASRTYNRGEVPPTLRGFLDGDPRDLATDGGLLLRLTDNDVAEMRAIERGDEQRAALIIKLMFAARRLAESRVMSGKVGAEGGDVISLMAPWCTECQMTEVNGRLVHGMSCRAGEVFRILDELTALGGTIAEFSISNGKEAEGRDGAAGEGIRPRGASLIEAARSLRNAALEEVVQIGRSLTWVCNVCRSSVTDLGKTGADILHGCDCWVGNALTVLSSGDLDDEASVPDATGDSRAAGRTYMCEHCGGVFESARSEEEANAEALANFGVARASSDPNMAEVCDDCFRKMTAAFPVQRPVVPAAVDLGQPWKLAPSVRPDVEEDELDILERDGEWMFGFCCLDDRQKAQLAHLVECVNACAAMREGGAR